MQLAPDVHRFHHSPFNWYVLVEQGRATLFDAGFPGHYGAFVRGLASLGLDRSALAGIVLTHAHADHLGFAERLRRETGVPVHIHEADARAAQRRLQLPWGGLFANAWRPYTASMLAHATWHGVFVQPPLSGVRPVRHGDVLGVPGRPEVIHLPGHTPGEIALWLPDRGVLISGDALVTRSLFTGRGGTLQNTPRALNDDYALARRSLDLLQRFGEVTLLPGHGEPWRGDLGEAVRAMRG